jgi:hypothetical protein
VTLNLNDLPAVSALAKAGSSLIYQMEPHDLIINYPVVSVRDSRRGTLVAYSSTTADFDSSLQEFATDFMSVGRGVK